MGQSIFGSLMPQNLQQMSSNTGIGQFVNPIQKVNFILQTMTNPGAFVKQAFPDIPDDMINDPNQILGYLQQSRGISNADIQNLKQQINILRGGR